MNQLLEELRRRKVLQWSIAYLAGAWILLQVLGFLFQTFHWPERILQAATIFLAIAFLAAPVIAWFHGEQGPQRVDVREGALLAAIMLLAIIPALYLATRVSAPNAATPV